MNTIVKLIINIFCVEDGKISLITKNDNSLLEIECINNLDLSCNNYIKDNFSIKNIDLNQVYTFSRKKTSFELKVLYVGIVDASDIELNDEFKLIELNKLDNNEYINKSIDYLKRTLSSSKTITKLYSKEFILPEIQKLYENLFQKKYDRRNFRKRLIKLDVIEDLNKYDLSKNGRPAKIYKFKELKEDIILFF